jgi:hypothetical protein
MTYKASDYTKRQQLDWAHLYRLDVLQQLQVDLYAAATSLGQTDAQAKQKIDDLFSAYPGEWSIYALVGASAIVTAIQNDATLPWLDTLVGGLTIRQRLINRLS